VWERVCACVRGRVGVSVCVNVCVCVREYVFCVYVRVFVRAVRGCVCGTH